MSEQEIATYNLWNTKKIQTANLRPKSVKNGCIYWTKIGKNIGCEVFGKGDNFTRPVLVLMKFNAGKSLFLGVPLTSKFKNSPYTHIFRDSNDKLQTALLDQVRIFDTRRILSRCGNVDETEFKNIKDKLANILAE